MRAALAVVLVTSVGLVACGLVGWLSRATGESFNWEVASATATAYGTLALAFVTWRLVASTRADAAGTLRVARLAEQDAEARLRPCVYPFSNRYLEPVYEAMGDPGHLLVLPLQNGGQGLALNVTGRVYWASGNAALATTTLAAGDNVELPLRSDVPVDQGEIWGELEYRDIRGRSWQTRFTIEIGPDGKLRPSIRAYGFTGALPQDAHPAGWQMIDGAPRLALADPATHG
jgi:hypothetical protein